MSVDSGRHLDWTLGILTFAAIVGTARGRRIALRSWRCFVRHPSGTGGGVCGDGMVALCSAPGGVEGYTVENLDT